MLGCSKMVQGCRGFGEDKNEGTPSLPKHYCTQDLHFISIFFIHHTHNLGTWHFQTIGIQLPEHDSCHCYFFIAETSESWKTTLVNFKNLNKKQTSPKDDVSFVQLNIFTQLSSLTIHEALWEWFQNTTIFCAESKKEPNCSQMTVDKDKPMNWHGQNWMIKN